MKSTELITTKQLAKILNIELCSVYSRINNKRNPLLQIPKPIIIQKRKYWKKATVDKIVENQKEYDSLCLSPPSPEIKNITLLLENIGNFEEMVQILLNHGYINLSAVYKYASEFISKKKKKIICKRDLERKAIVENKEYNNILLNRNDRTAKTNGYLNGGAVDQLKAKLNTLESFKLRINNRKIRVFKLADVLQVCKLNFEPAPSHKEPVTTLVQLSKITNLPQDRLRSYADLNGFPRPVLIGSSRERDSHWDTKEVLNWFENNNIAVML